ncbi:MAG: outer membrane protein assembly factor BamD [Rhodobacteraceae bacterium]|nr:outer membrane protein assembly factor BamD [Paracoccaceae bacterium]
MSLAKRTISCLISVLIVLVMTGCAQKDKEIVLENMTPEELYQRGESQMAVNRFERAAANFEEVERIYPYSIWSRRATLQAAYAYNLGQKYQKSREAAERFITFYPGDDNAAYAQYLIAMSYYNQLDLKGQDRDNGIRAIEELNEVLVNYRDSSYAQSAELAMDVVADRLAEKEMEVGRFYLKQNHYTSAIKRFQNVVDNKFLDAVDIAEERSIEESSEPILNLSEVYQKTTSHVPEALHRLVESYLAIGLVSEAEESAAILGYNFNSTDWYERTYNLLQQVEAEVPQKSPNTDSFFNRFLRQGIRGQWI